MKVSPLFFSATFIFTVTAFAQNGAPIGKPPVVSPQPSARPGIVAGEIRAKGEPIGVSPNAIFFNAPNGDGRSGAKGIFLKNGPLTGKQGSNWSFRYSRDGTAYGVQIVHPHGNGQVIIHLSKNRIGISTPKNWTEVGWSNGSDKLVKKTPGFAKLLPLVDGQPTAIESRLDSNGNYELAVEGMVVATAKIPKTNAISIGMPQDKTYPECGRKPGKFEGPNLPMDWTAGNAALILSPMDGGANIARSVSFRGTAK